MQHSGLLSCAVTESEGAPLGMNSQGTASDRKERTLCPAGKSHLTYCSYWMHRIGYKCSDSVFRSVL